MVTLRVLGLIAIASIPLAAVSGCSTTPTGTGGAGGNPAVSSGSTSAVGSTGSAATAGGVEDWSQWTCTTVGSNYCYAVYNETYFIKCYPTTQNPCYFGSNVIADGSSCPANMEAGCESCKFAFDNCALDWILN